ncbi:MAG: hypothetical protein II610_08960 [Treponema sp.]|nr:hypothetical protein [Treponema sp.]
MQDQKAAARLERYQKILCPAFPDFLKKYLALKILERLKGIGLLCGTDWTLLFHNRFYYSRYDHSLNCALIVWNWTRDKKMTLAALLHDVSTPAFSHVIDFKNGDALTQESTEDKNAAMIRSDAELAAALAQDGLTAADVCDYHKFSICDNEVPQLSADRLEYMFPSGAALEGWFSLRAVKRFYADLFVAKDERGRDEFSFKTKKIALDYFRRILKIGYFLQRNKDKIAMELMARVVDAAIKCGALREEELWQLSEREIIMRWDEMLEARETDASLGTNEAAAFSVSEQSLAMPKNNGQQKSNEVRDFLRLYKTYRTMKKVRGSSAPLDGYFCVQLAVKRRWINPLVAADSLGLANDSGAKVQSDASQKTNEAARRICDINARAKKAAQKFLAYNDTPYACVKIKKLDKNGLAHYNF